MVSLNLPEELYRKLEARARETGRSAPEEARVLLEALLARASGPDDDAAETERLEEARKNREELKHLYLTDEEILAARKWGRE